MTARRNSGSLAAALALIAAGGALSGCTEVEATTSEGYEPATLNEVAGSELKQVTLTAEGAQRTGLRTAPVQRSGDRRAGGREPGRDHWGGRGVRHRARDRRESLRMRWIVGSSLRFRWLVVFAAAALTAVGIAQIPSAKVDVFPEFAPPRVEIQTIALGNSSIEVEELITVPIENQLNGLPGLDQLRSQSVAQLSSIELIFDRGTDELRARQLVQERLAQVTAHLPTWASPPWMMPPVSSTSRIMKIGISSNEVNPLELSAIAYWKINQRLMRVPGVAHVDIYGERLQQRHVQVDPARLARYGVPLQRVMDVTADALDAGLLQYSAGAVIGTGGFVDDGERRLNIRNLQAIETPEQLARVPVVERGGRTLRLADMGRVIEDHMPV